MSEIKFLVIGDFHYKKKMYAATVRDLETMFAEANKENANFCVHVGDFCNDYKGSPELVSKYLNNEYNLSVFGVYGNHELESAENSMQRVTPLLSNRNDLLVYGTESGKIEDGSVAYSYYDTAGFRLVFLDTNYSLTPDGEYEHNRTKSYGAPRENSKSGSLGPRQIAWLESVLDDAAKNALRCVVFSHVAFSGVWASSPDTEAVKRIFKEANAKRAGTVLLAINGHLHSNNKAFTEGGVSYFDCPASINGWWQSAQFYPYKEEDEENPKYTFDYLDYDSDGALKGSYKMPYSKLSMGAQSLFYESPLFAIVTVTDEGKIKIKGRKTNFSYGVSIPLAECYDPEIKDFEN